MVEKRRYLPNLSEILPRHHRQRNRRYSRHYQAMYVSPQIDNGYDIADYRNIDPSYGTMADFEQLVVEAHKRNIRIVMDMVFNHSSTFHEWFQKGEDPSSEYHDYYIWREL